MLDLKISELKKDLKVSDLVEVKFVNDYPETFLTELGKFVLEKAKVKTKSFFLDIREAIFDNYIIEIQVIDTDWCRPWYYEFKIIPRLSFPQKIKHLLSRKEKKNEMY